MIRSSTAGADLVKVIVTGASQQSFPRIAVQFEVKRSDGSFLLDANRDDFRVTEEGRDVEVVEFQAPQNKQAIATTVVLVVDRSLSMEEEDRIGGLKRAVRSFLEKLPEGSKVAVIAFGSDVDRLTDFTTDRAQMQQAVDALKPEGATRFYDAVAEALQMLDRETGRRVALALTDGEDTFSQSATLESVIASGQRLGLPVYTLGLGNGRRNRERRPPPPGKIDARPVLSRPQRRRAAGDLRTDRRADSVELFDDLSKRSQARRRYASPREYLLSRQQNGSRRNSHLHPGYGGSGRRLVAALPRPAVRACGLARAPFQGRPPRQLTLKASVAADQDAGVLDRRPVALVGTADAQQHFQVREREKQTREPRNLSAE